ncbi:MAG: anaerobic sulfatase maturase [Acidimicrobiia bacterium]
MVAARPEGAPPSFHLLAKPTGAVCNLDCKYCFFLSKDALYPGASTRMSDVTLEAYIRQLIEAHSTPEVTVAWQGGEPTLMGLDFFRRAVELAEECARPGQRIEHSIQTNGTLLDAEWANFFAEHAFLVGLSIDGPKPMHDAYRVWKNGRGSYDEVIRAWDLLRRAGADVNILCSLHAANVRHPVEVYQFFRDQLEARYLQFIPVIERATEETLEIANAGWSDKPGRKRLLYTQSGTLVTERSVLPEQYGEFLVSVFDEWVVRDVGTVYVQMFDVTLGAYLDLHSLCIHAPTCGTALALEHNGDVYSCDHFVEPDFLLGNIHSETLVELVSKPKQQAFGQHKLDSLPRFCRECDVRFACHGGCPKDRFRTTPEGEAGLNYLCPSYKLFFSHTRPALSRMAELLRSGRYADEAMAEFALSGGVVDAGA